MLVHMVTRGQLHKLLPNFSRGAVDSCEFPPAESERPSVSTSSPAFDVVDTFYVSHSDGYVVMSHYSFNLHFFGTNDGAHLFMGVLAACISSSVKCRLTSFACFLSRLLDGFYC